MSRGQENQVFNSAQQQNATQAGNAQSSYTQAQQDIGDYAQQAATFAAENPYVQGGEYQTAQNQSLANTADASGQSAGQAIQGAAVRTGQNAGGAVAGTEAMQQQNERNLAAQEATANQQRIGSQATYNAEAVKNAEVPAQLETALSGQQLSGGNQELGEEEKAAATPSTADVAFGDILQAGADAAKVFAPTGGK
jgi:hypothetical protein